MENQDGEGEDLQEGAADIFKNDGIASNSAILNAAFSAANASRGSIAINS